MHYSRLEHSYSIGRDQFFFINNSLKLQNILTLGPHLQTDSVLLTNPTLADHFS